MLCFVWFDDDFFFLKGIEINCLLFVCLFIWLLVYLEHDLGRDRERDRERQRETERDRERIEAGSTLVSVEPNAGLELMNCDIMTRAETKSRMLN